MPTHLFHILRHLPRGPRLSGSGSSRAACRCRPRSTSPASRPSQCLTNFGPVSGIPNKRKHLTTNTYESTYENVLNSLANTPFHKLPAPTCPVRNTRVCHLAHPFVRDVFLFIFFFYIRYGNLDTNSTCDGKRSSLQDTGSPATYHTNNKNIPEAPCATMTKAIHKSIFPGPLKDTVCGKLPTDAAMSKRKRCFACTNPNYTS